MEKNWIGLPYKPISDFYKEKWGEKVYKIPVSIVDTCPNREGLKGMQTCLFCDEWGSAANSDSFQLDLQEQILQFKINIKKKYNAKSFLIYFQSYTNTFIRLSELRKQFELVMKNSNNHTANNLTNNNSDVKGLVIGTRPDCLSQSLLDLWCEYSQKTFLGVELGVQSISNAQLNFLRRGHTWEQSVEAINKISNIKNGKINIGIHLMFGLPNETEKDIIKTAMICNELPIDNVKLHHLHVLKKTPLEELYLRGEFQPIDFLSYARKVQLFLEHLSPRIYIHRLAAYASRWNELVAPAWTANKMKSHQEIIDHLRQENSCQSKYYVAMNSSEKQ